MKVLFTDFIWCVQAFKFSIEIFLRPFEKSVVAMTFGAEKMAKSAEMPLIPFFFN